MRHDSLPSWLKKEIPSGSNFHEVRRVISDLHLNIVCYNARCPNIGECFNQKRVTFLIMGDVCSRSCRFCAIHKGMPLPLSLDEPSRIAQSVYQLNLTHVFITSVTRDDLHDGGASFFHETINAIREKAPQTLIEVLVPDFRGSLAAISKVIQAKPAAFGHNTDTVPRLYSRIKPKANYSRSLEVLKGAKKIAPDIPTKSGLMLGLGETDKEIIEVMEDLRRVECDFLTLGQYLAPSQKHLPAARFAYPIEFEQLRAKALEMGFMKVSSAPFVRSSYF